MIKILLFIGLSLFLMTGCGGSDKTLTGGSDVVSSEDSNSGINASPTANVGSTKSIVVGLSSTYTFDASSSSDSDGDELTYKWSLVSKPLSSDVSLLDNETVNAKLKADVEGKYVISLVVNDGKSDSAENLLTVVAINAEYNIGEINLGDFLDIKFDGDDVYIVEKFFGLKIVDLRNPELSPIVANNTQKSSNYPNQLDKEQLQKDLIRNKAAIALMFNTFLKERLNLEPILEPLDATTLYLDPVYRAYVAILQEVTHENSSVKNIEFLLNEAFSSPSTAIDLINRLKVQYGSLSQDEETIATIKSLLEGLKAFTFETVTSKTTKRVWMDRNLGASAPCNAVTDEACFGDYYQWGRYPDGHEKAGSSISLRVQNTYNPNDGKFVINSSDWTALDANGAQRELTWNVCPVGFRVPTLAEVQAENMSKNADLFKLAFAGQRDDDGFMRDSSALGFLHATTPTSLGLTKIAKFTASYDTYSVSKRTVGAPIRCIQVVEPVAWEVGEWGACKGACGSTSGYQSRRATCQDATGTVLNESYCAEAKPSLSQVCTIESPTECPINDTATCSIGVDFSRVGYYDMGLGEGSASQVSSIENAGLTAVKLLALNSAELDTVDIMYVQNPYGSKTEYLSQLGAITSFVNSGKILIIHDRDISASSGDLLPNGDSIVFSESYGAEIEIIDNNLETGIGGTINDDSLDGGSHSNHGYAELATLPAGATILMNNGTANQIVTFSYPYGNGTVVYSTIPLDHYFAGSGSAGLNAAMQTYATNLLEDLSSSSVTASVNENQTDAITLEAMQGCTLTYSIEGGDSASFDVNATTGVVTFKVAPDYETKDTYTFTAKASDGQGNETTQEVTITILDVMESCKNILDSGDSTGDGMYTINPTGAANIEVYCDMTTDGGGWTMWYTTDSTYDIADSVTTATAYGTDGYSKDLRDVAFKEVMYHRHSDDAKDWFSRDDNVSIKVRDYIAEGVVNAGGSNFGLWTGHGGANTGYSYQLVIADNVWMEIGLMISGYTVYNNGLCYKLPGSWCADTTSNYYRVDGDFRNDGYAGVAFRQNGHTNVPYQLMSVGVR